MSSTYAPTPVVPGDPDALDDLALACRGTAGALRDDASRLRVGDVADWSGPAAHAFTQSVHGLPRDLVRAADSYDTVARALTTYAADLRAVLRQARRAETELDELDGMLLAERHGLVGGLDPVSVAARGPADHGVRAGAAGRTPSPRRPRRRRGAVGRDGDVPGPFGV